MVGWARRTHQEAGTGGVEAPLAGNGGHGDRLRSTQVSRGKGESECERELGLDEAGEQGSSLASPSDTRR